VAFETFSENLAGTHATPGRRTRRIMYAVSAIVHGSAVMAAIAYSFWHVEELTPPRVTVTFMSVAAPPPPPPPPPPLGGGPAAKRHVKTPTSVVPPTIKVPEVVQPRPPDLEPKHVDPEPKVATSNKIAEDVPPGQKVFPGAPPGAGVPDGVKGGLSGGVVGGAGTLPAPSAPLASKFLPPQMGAQQKVSGADPDFPAALRTAGSRYQVKAKVCVGISGTVDSVVVLKHANPTLDGNVVSMVKTWRFRPLMANGNPLPFCYFANFDFSSE
jgi:periplasmic protein TonB